MSYRVIKASEIGEYVYCRRAWWLRRRAGQQSRNIEEMAEGAAYHRHHEGLVRQANWGQRAALLIIFLAVGAIAFWIVQLL